MLFLNIYIHIYRPKQMSEKKTAHDVEKVEKVSHVFLFK